MISVFLTMGLNGEISKNGSLVQFKELDTYFKITTKGCPVLFGKVAFEQNKIPLKGMTVYVLSSKDYKNKDIITVKSVEEYLELTKESSEVFIVGGGSVFSQTSKLWERAYLNILNMGFEDADIVMSVPEERVWEDIKEPSILRGKNGLYAKCYVMNRLEESEESTDVITESL